MPFAFDFCDDGRVLEWTATDDGADPTVVDDYTPRFFVGPRDAEAEIDLTRLRRVYERHPDVVGVEVVERRPGFRREAERLLAVDACHVDRVTSLARQARQLDAYPVGELACYNVDFTRGFRYCLERGVDPTPETDLTTLSLSVPVPETTDGAYETLTVDGDTVTGSPATILDAVGIAVEDQNPDVLVCSTAEIVPTLYSMADQAGRDEFTLSRWPGVDYQQLAGQSTYTSYGRVGHSPARYNVPGRAIVDESATFLYDETNLDGVLDLVGRSHKPVQELAWASIGTVLTAIQVREAAARGVLVPWNSWRHELFKPMATLHDADRGGFIFAPDAGVHENVHELDFSSLYPNIISTRNVSPDVIRCDCHRDRADVPGLDYAICDERGYLVDVLEPIIDDRDTIKAAIREERAAEDPDEARLAALEGRSEALKWILVACFGYQGFANAKFGRIECHEAINAFAREILLTAKERLEAGGWEVVHGIVDSIWVRPAPDVPDGERTDLDTLAAEITDSVGIRLEYEAAHDWVAFVPRRDDPAGALTKYFGRLADSGEFKIRGIEARQRSTPSFVERVQRDCLDRLDETRASEPVLERLHAAIGRLRAGRVDPDRLAERIRISKPVEAYTQYTHTVAALERARDQGLDIHPGQEIAYIVVDDDKSSRDRVSLAHEGIDSYDTAYYETQLVRAVESVLAPLGWDREEIRQWLAETTDATLGAYSG
ncbi:type B DNA-directed DNA polymerase [Halosimplex rubrum]|uniref:DNA-directed DNA polymerase n=1 Tax=Halosimplex rubrum TaxID=869889 RepID=A0A7D5T892_9EURY|nr:type B DNA-directed DNA polymerase [Halosimplex rubrum]QLH79669.1 type B DNA-directed DNA polymerase [Halosimplex rubrum]